MAVGTLYGSIVNTAHPCVPKTLLGGKFKIQNSKFKIQKENFHEFIAFCLTLDHIDIFQNPRSRELSYYGVYP
jgi:hypothetical protein